MLPTTSMANRDDPTQTDFLTVPYYLTYYRRDMTVRNEISRFLQQNTFGPTREEIDKLEARYNELRGPDFVPPPVVVEELTPELPVELGGAEATERHVLRLLEETSNITNASNVLTHHEAMSALQLEWVSDQMNASTFASGEFTSLRKYWRKRLNARKTETYRIGESGPHACEKHSRWRKFAFTKADVQFAMDLRWGSQELKGTFQNTSGHEIEVERVVSDDAHSRLKFRRPLRPRLHLVNYAGESTIEGLFLSLGIRRANHYHNSRFTPASPSLDTARRKHQSQVARRWHP